MSDRGRNRRGFTDYTLNPNIARALYVFEPRLGTAFGHRKTRDGSRWLLPDPPNARQDWTIKARLVAKLGPRGYGRLLQRLEVVTSTTPAPQRKRRRSRQKGVTHARSRTTVALRGRA